MTASRTSTRTPRRAPQEEPQEEPQAVEDVGFEEIEIELPEYDEVGRPRTDDDGKPIVRVVPGRQTTVHGITVQVPDEALDDFELLDDLRAAQDDDDGSRLPALLRRMVGEDYKRILNALRDPVTRRVTVEAGAQFVWDLFRALNPNS